MTLPPRGSLQDRILRETVERERYADYKKQVYLGRTIVFALLGQTTEFDALEEDLSLAIFQTAFNPKAMEARMAKLQQAMRKRREELLRDARMLERVASYSETGEDQQETQQHADVFARRLAERAVKKDE